MLRGLFVVHLPDVAASSLPEWFGSFTKPFVSLVYKPGVINTRGSSHLWWLTDRNKAGTLCHEDLTLICTSPYAQPDLASVSVLAVFPPFTWQGGTFSDTSLRPSRENLFCNPYNILFNSAYGRMLNEACFLIQDKYMCSFVTVSPKVSFQRSTST